MRKKVENPTKKAVVPGQQSLLSLLDEESKAFLVKNKIFAQLEDQSKKFF